MSIAHGSMLNHHSKSIKVMQIGLDLYTKDSFLWSAPITLDIGNDLLSDVCNWPVLMLYTLQRASVGLADLIYPFILVLGIMTSLTTLLSGGSHFTQPSYYQLGHCGGRPTC